MLKKRWLIVLALVLIILVAVFTLVTILQSRSPTISISHAGCNAQPSTTHQSSSPSANACRRKLLVFSKTGAFRHASIPSAIAALKKLVSENNVAADFTEDPTVFNDANLAQYDAVVFLLTTGEILNADQQAAFERYIRSSGGYVGVHSASDTEYNWAWYGGLVGAYFDRVHGHSKVVQATLDVVDRTNPSTAMLPAHWIRTDEWYNFATNPSGHVHVLMTIDETTYKGGVMGPDHPIAWYHDYDGGRAWYTALGHTSESYSEPLFLAHLWGGITYAMGPKPRAALISPAQEQLALLFKENHKSAFAEQDTAVNSDDLIWTRTSTRPPHPLCSTPCPYRKVSQTDAGICRSDEWSFVSTTGGRNGMPPYSIKGATHSCCTCC